MSGYLFAAAGAVLVCACYGAGRAALSLRWTAVVAIVACGIPAAQLTIRPAGTAAATGFVAACLVFVLLPLLGGRYVAQQRAVRDQDRLRERVRIARDMHDSLGRALSLAAIQAAALEVSDLPASQRQAAAQLGTAIRASSTELHEIVAVLRGPARGLSAIGGLIAEFRAAGVDVSMRSYDTPRPLSGPADEAAYRVIEEGLTNGMRHAPGQPVSITVSWRAGLLTITIVNPVASPADAHAYMPGSGLDGLGGRLREADGTLTHELADGTLSYSPTDGRAAVTAALASRPEVALLDIKMPVLDGLAAATEIRRQAPGVRVVLLTSFGTQPHARRAIEEGAAGFVLKSCTPDELIRAVRAAHAGDAYLSPQVTRFVLDMIPRTGDGTRQRQASARLAALTPRESQVLALIADGLPNGAIAGQLRMTESSAKTYVSRILAKLGCANRVQAALLARDARN